MADRAGLPASGERQPGVAGQDSAQTAPPREEIAIVGMACLFPGAPDLHTYWRNIVSGVDAVADVPAGRWDADTFYDPTAADDDRVYSKRGGYLPTQIPFDPLAYGIMPRAVAGGEVDQFLVLKLVHDALADAGCGAGLPNPERTEFVLGRGNYLGPGNSNLFQRSVGIEQALRVLKAVHPKHTPAEIEAIRRDLRSSLPDFGPELGPTHIPNVVTGRAANRLDFMGSNYTVDAGCASSLIAIETAMQNLLTGKCDVAVAGGSHTFTCVPLLMVFSTLNALSRRSEIRPFDEGADGTLPGEGVGIVVLKRRTDAERDGDRIYAVIKGVGSASDGRALSLLSPRVEGEVLALRRAYARAGIDPRTVGLVEAHGTATPVGDLAEVQALKAVFGARDGERPHIGLGTVKSMIGHAMPASGVAGLIKTALALYHKVLPPTLHCDVPSPRLGLDETPFYVNTATRPWINAGPGKPAATAAWQGPGTDVPQGASRLQPPPSSLQAQTVSHDVLVHASRAEAPPRRAGVNAFGFGGINAHVVLEEHPDGAGEAPDLLPWDSELLLVGSATRAGLVGEVQRLCDYLTARPGVALADLAYTLSRRFSWPACRLAIVATSRDDLDNKLARARTLLSGPDCAQIKDPRGIYFFAQPRAGSGKVAYLFPGEGSQHINMLAELCLHFPEVRAVFDAADGAILAQGRSDLVSADVFPPPFHSKEERERAERRLWSLDRQCEAIMVANRAMLTLFDRLGLRPDMMVGHSIGEWSSLTASGIADPDPPVEALRSLDAMAKALAHDPSIPAAVLLAIAANRAVAEAVVAGIEGAYVALDNCPHQVVLAASETAAEQVMARLRERGVGFARSRFDRGSHTPLFAGFIELVRRHFESIAINAPRMEVYSCCTAAPLPHDPDEIRRLLARSWEQPVEYHRTIEAMYEAGARIFVEVGPRGVLSAFTDDILRGKDALVLAVDLPKWSELSGLNHLVGLLTAQGLDLDIPFLYRRRPLHELTLDVDRDAPDTHTGTSAVMLDLAIPMMQLSEETLAGLRPNGTAHTATRETATCDAGCDDTCDCYAEPSGPQTQASGRHGRVAADGHGTALLARPNETPLASNGHHRDVASFTQPQLACAALEDPTSAQRQSQAHYHTVQPQPDAQTPCVEPRHPIPTLERLTAMEPPDGTTETPLAAPSPPMARGDGVMTHYLQTMGNFLRAEQRVLESYLHRSRLLRARGAAAHEVPRPDGAPGAAFQPPGPGTAPRPAGPDNPAGPLPLLGEVLSLVPGRSLVARRRIDPDEDLYLHDHTFGGKMSVTDPTLEPLTVAPLTISLELMAEAAAQLLPDLLLTGMADVRAHRWLQVDESAPTVLEITARRLEGPAPQVRVEVCEVTVDGAADAMVIEGTMLFGQAYEAAPPPQPFTPSNARPAARSAAQMYSEMWMFHGPLFQGVASLDASGDDGIVGTLEVLPTAGLFRSTERPRLLTDVALLDAAGQLLGYWAKERLASSFVVFPIRVAAVHIHGPNLPVGTRVQCRVRITELMPQTVKVDMDVFDAQGRLWMRVCGWQDWRFHIAGELYDYWRFPSATVMSKPFPVPAPARVSAGAITCYRMDTLAELGQTMVAKCVAYMTLNHAERRAYHGLRGPVTRRTEWLVGRIAAKDAVRVLLRERYGLQMGPGDVEIAADAHGRPEARGAWQQHVGAPLSISLAHSNGIGIALAAETLRHRQPTGRVGVGIDLQGISPRPMEFDTIAFAPEESALLWQADGPARDERRMRFWCAKEAVAKALGRGLIEGPRSVAIEAWNEATGVAEVGLRGALAAAFPQLAGRRLSAYTVRDGDHIVAVSLGETV